MPQQGPTREQVFGALYSLLYRNVQGVAFYSRRFALPAKIPSGETIPGACKLMVWEQPEHTTRKGGTPIKNRVWEAWVVVYFRNDQKDVPGATIINPIIDSIEALLNEPAGTPVQTLGGLVTGIWIAGDTHIETGDTDENGLGGAVIPVHILVP